MAFEIHRQHRRSVFEGVLDDVVGMIITAKKGTKEEKTTL